MASLGTGHGVSMVYSNQTPFLIRDIQGWTESQNPQETTYLGHYYMDTEDQNTWKYAQGGVGRTYESGDWIDYGAISFNILADISKQHGQTHDVAPDPYLWQQNTTGWLMKLRTAQEVTISFPKRNPLALSGAIILGRCVVESQSSGFLGSNEEHLANISLRWTGAPHYTPES